MRAKKRPTLRSSAFLLGLACHALMGTALGLAFSIGMIATDAFGITTLISHGADAQTTTMVLVATVTLPIAIGATLTGFLFMMLEER